VLALIVLENARNARGRKDFYMAMFKYGVSPSVAVQITAEEWNESVCKNGQCKVKSATCKKCGTRLIKGQCPKCDV
jgi:hypothetical protein